MSSLRLSKRRTPNVVRGGRAIPLDNNGELYYLQGRSHAQGGIDIGRNPRTGIEAEGGEVVQIKPNELRVLSAQDFIGGGVSPAKQVLAGANPDKVFNEQEAYKDANRLNDDGTKYNKGGMIATINGNIKNGLISTPRPKAKGGTNIHIKPSKRGTFTDAAKAHSKSVQGFSSQVLANKDNYNSAMVKKANFARNASKWNRKACGGRKKAEGGTSETIYDAIDRMNREQLALQDSIDSGYYIETDSGFVRNPNMLNDIVVTPGINSNDVDAVSSADSRVDEMHQMDTPVERQLDEVTVTAKRKPKYSKRQQAFYDRGGYNHPAFNSYLPKREGIKPDNGGIRLDDKSVPRSYGPGTKVPSYLLRPPVGVLDYDKIREQEVQDTVNRFTVGAGLPKVENDNNKKEGKTEESKPSPTGGQEKSTQSTNSNSNSNSSSSSSSQNPRGRISQSKPNTYSVTNYEIQPDGSLKANGNRTGQGFKQYSKRKNQRTITDARVSRPWRETIGSDAEILNYIANGDAFEHKRWQDRHSKMSQETGYDYNKKRAIQHEDVSGYSHDFNEKFNLANRKLGNYTTPAGRTGDNAQGERRKKFGGRRLAPNGTTINLERPYEDDWYGAQVEMRQLGKNLNREDYKYLQEQIDARRQSPLRRAVFERADGYAGVIDELATPEVKGIDVAAPKIDLGPIGKTVVPQAHARTALSSTPTPTLRRGIKWNDDLTSAVSNGLGSLGAFGAELWGSNLRSWTPHLETPVKLKTNYNINPELDRIRESSQEAYRDIDANTASSSTSLARKQRVRNQAQYAANQQWADKENKETTLINQDKLNRQGVRNRNANRLNVWAQSDANIANTRRQLRGAAWSNLFNNLNQTVQGYIGRRDQRRRDEATERMFNRAYPHGAAMARNIQSRESSGDATIPSLATNPIAIAGRIESTDRKNTKRCDGKIKRK